MGSVFISYRRGDSEGEARALVESLRSRLGKRAVFVDVDNIPLGVDFRQVLDERLEACRYLLAVIGPGWLSADASGKRRLDSPVDFVRQEIAAALRRNIVVVPVLLHAAPMPSEDQLPDDIKELAFRQSFEVRHGRWDSDVDEMVRRIGLAPTRQRRRWIAFAAAAVVSALVAAILLSLRDRPDTATASIGLGPHSDPQSSSGSGSSEAPGAPRLNERDPVETEPPSLAPRPTTKNVTPTTRSSEKPVTGRTAIALAEPSDFALALRAFGRDTVYFPWLGLSGATTEVRSVDVDECVVAFSQVDSGFFEKPESKKTVIDFGTVDPPAFSVRREPSDTDTLVYYSVSWSLEGKTVSLISESEAKIHRIFDSGIAASNACRNR